MWFRSQERGDDIYLRRYEHFPEYYRFVNLKLSIKHLGITMFWIFKNYQSRQLGAGPLDGPLLRLPRPGKRIWHKNKDKKKKKLFYIIRSRCGRCEDVENWFLFYIFRSRCGRSLTPPPSSAGTRFATGLSSSEFEISHHFGRGVVVFSHTKRHFAGIKKRWCTFQGNGKSEKETKIGKEIRILPFRRRYYVGSSFSLKTWVQQGRGRWKNWRVFYANQKRKIEKSKEGQSKTIVSRQWRAKFLSSY